MAISKIILNGVTQMDTTIITATEADVVLGKTFLLADGTIGTGQIDEGGTPSSPNLQSKTVTPTGSEQTITADSNYDGLSSVIVNPIPSTYVQPSGTLNISTNGTFDVTNYSSANVAISSTPSMNIQIAEGINRATTSSYTAVGGQSITVAVTGTYNIYWIGFRSSTGGTNGSCLYIDDNAHSSGEQTTFNNHGQSIKLTGVSLTKDQVVTVRARSRGSNYYMYVGNLTIVQTA